MILLLILFVNLLVKPTYEYRLTFLEKKPKRVTTKITIPEEDSDLQFKLGKVAFSLLPLTPELAGRRKTLLKEIVKDQIWTLDQVQGLVNVNVPVRSVVIKLKNGGLFINNPVASTKECVAMIRDLEKKHGYIKYIVLSSVAVEHKGTAGAFSTYFPNSKIYYQPGQFSFPVNLPPFFFFPFGHSIQEIPMDSKLAPWGDEIEHYVLGPLKVRKFGAFSETAFFHKSSNTLLVTDSIIKVDNEPPSIIQEDPRALLCLARNDMFEVVKDTPINRRKGWRRMVLFALIFQPSSYDLSNIPTSLLNTTKVSSEMKLLGRGTVPFNEGWYPFTWVRSELPSFRAFQKGLLVPPVLQKLIFNREPEMVIEWVDKVSQWPIKRIIPSHLANDIKASGKDFREAFRFLEAPATTSTSTPPIFQWLSNLLPNKSCDETVLESEYGFIYFVDNLLTKIGVIKPVASLYQKK